MGRWARVSSVLGVLLFLALAIPTRLYAVGPTISSLTPNSGALGASVSIAERDCGSTQGSRTVKFNGTQAKIAGWSAISIAVSVRSAATTGNVVAGSPSVPLVLYPKQSEEVVYA